MSCITTPTHNSHKMEDTRRRTLWTINGKEGRGLVWLVHYGGGEAQTLMVLFKKKKGKLDERVEMDIQTREGMDGWVI